MASSPQRIRTEPTVKEDNTTVMTPKGYEKVTFKYENQLPRLPIPDLKESCQRYLRILEPLQTPESHQRTKLVMDKFQNGYGQVLQEKLKGYASTKASYIEDFWFDSYLRYTDSVVLNLNPFFVLEDDPTPSRNNQILRAASLIYSSLKYINALRVETLEPDMFRKQSLCMIQHQKLFSTFREPTVSGDIIRTVDNPKHIVVLCRKQFYWFDVLYDNSEVAVTEAQLIEILKAIKADSLAASNKEVASKAVGVLTTENRKVWANLRESLINSSKNNKDALQIVDSALFIVCLDSTAPIGASEIASNVLRGSYNISETGVQCGTCTNRWYDKLQIIVCENGAAGMNFEHAGVDGHTVLRFASDVYTDTILRFAKSINSKAYDLFKIDSTGGVRGAVDIVPKKLEWELNSELRTGIRFAESRLSDLLCQNDVEVLEFDEYGKSFITKMNLSPDAFVQMAFQAAYYGLYGRPECTYEPALTKNFYHGRTEGIRPVTRESVRFVKTFCSDAANFEKLKLLRAAIKAHVERTREASQGKGVDRHFYAMYCIWKEFDRQNHPDMPEIFGDESWTILNRTVISTSNCGNPSLRFFGFGPVVPEGFGIGYIIKDEGIQFCASSKHRQTKRFLTTLNNYLMEVKEMLENEQMEQFPNLFQQNLKRRRSQSMVGGYGFFDAGAVETQRLPANSNVGRRLELSEVGNYKDNLSF